MPSAAAKPATADSPAEPAAQPKIATRLWEALTHLSVGRSTSDPKGEKHADIVHKGETVELTEEQARGFLTRHRVPVIRPAAQQNQAAPDIKARDLFGTRPPAQAFGARPDPADASAVTEIPEAQALNPADPRNAPEANDPVTDLSVDPDAAKDK
jgi:hypothetical protein